jgi:ATP-dependent RNA helicase DBP3
LEEASKKKKKKDKKRAAADPPIASSESDASAYLSANCISLTLPPSASAFLPVQAFSALRPLLPAPLHPIVDHLLRFPAPTPIQACAWPPALAARDVVGIAETGSGKTLAFGLPLLASVLAAPATKGVHALVLAPTRELALQSHDALSGLPLPAAPP